MSLSWSWLLLVFFGGVSALMASGLPVAFAFLTVNLAASLLLFGQNGLNQLVLNMYDAVKSFTLVPIPMFILMGELLYRSGLATRALDGISQWLGRLPGRLSILSVVGGTVFAAASGSAIANTAMMGGILVPEMVRRGYSYLMAAGPILASGSLAMIIPPSSMAVLLGAIGNISVGKLLIGGIIPGLLMALASIGYIVVRCWINPSLAPPYDVQLPPLSQRVLRLIRDVLPVGILVFLVIGLIFIGLATPTESAALGVLGACLILTTRGDLRAALLRDAMVATARVAGMTLLIMAAAATFSQLLAITGATQRLIELVLSIRLHPLMVIAIMQLLVLLLGGPLDQISILMITMPVFSPIVDALGFDPVWFGILMLINLDLANLTPPLGLTLYVLKGVVPQDFSMEDITRSALPFIAIDVAVMAVLMAFPILVTWLPDMMG